MSYSDAEKNSALIRLAANKYNFQKTSDETGIQIRTLRNWEKNYPKKGITELLDHAIAYLLANIPEFKRGSDWAIALGILIDKWLIIQGEPTQRTENLLRGFGNLTDDERTAVIDEANRILAEAIGGSRDQGAAGNGSV